VQAVNRISNVLTTQFGAPAVTNFNTGKQIIADEVLKAGSWYWCRCAAGSRTIASPIQCSQQSGPIDGRHRDRSEIDGRAGRWS